MRCAPSPNANASAEPLPAFATTGTETPRNTGLASERPSRAASGRGLTSRPTDPDALRTSWTAPVQGELGWITSCFDEGGITSEASEKGSDSANTSRVEGK